MIPYYQTRGIDLTVPEVLGQAGDLRTYAAGLKGNESIRLILNRNDILLADEDLKWIEATFGGERLRTFDKGGHLGNLSQPAVQTAILRALDGMKSTQ